MGTVVSYKPDLILCCFILVDLNKITGSKWPGRTRIGPPQNCLG